MQEAWEGFEDGNWTKEVDVRDFIQKNYTPYEGDESFLVGPTERTTKLWDDVMALMLKEREQGGVLDMDTKVVTGILSHPAGYIDAEHPERETIVGLQTDKPLKRALHVNGGIRIACQAASQHGYEVDPEIVDFYTNKRKTHNAGVFDVYKPEMRACRSAHIITGLPDGYGRGRIIGDYRRVALYGVDALIEDKRAQKSSTPSVMNEDNIRLREELSEQIRSLQQLIELGKLYGFDIARPAANTQEAIQWMYLAYLAAVKDQNGAAMSIGRTSTFIDIYAERDLKNGVFTEEQIQEFVDHFIMKLRMVKFARTPEYQNLFSGDPQWVTESIGGMGVDGRTLVTKMSYRYLHTLETMGTSPEPNLTVLWSTRLPQAFKEFCAKTSIASSSIQYENDDVMRVYHGDDYAIACCVSSMRVGKEMQFFGARANLAKCLLYALNGGVDEVSKKQIGPKYRPVEGDTLDFDDVMSKYKDMMKWLAGVYVNTLNIIHYMHDKYCYEAIQMALHDKDVHRWFATGIAGLSVVADSLSAIKYAKVHPVRDENGVIVDFDIEGDFPKYGNDDDRVDSIAHDIVHEFMECIRRHETYRNSVPTTSVLTITSNVVYGKNTGATPDGRKAGVPFAPGANPMHQRDSHGAIASLSSVSKLPFRDAQDGISNTFSIVPGALGKEDQVMFGDLDLGDIEFENPVACCDCTDSSAPEGAEDR
ncbi:formate C-acetyltransferase [Collinsella stercoris]|uniref:Formate acetyltransferase n=1 Tax=Collinsella stercoris DSM 13279 TaxID=445975 RepID=B6G7U9_9ACTN|nr:formate C-acetyltransferase [Collinsella stercoris]EEA91647.1 formate C-acetyltransferase [Collinsella stercoris DSM 13279]UEA44878.1 formate C-acetyltransferase [Collinsella stercoris DSM 13279]UWP12599.1 formate C-acetyltransferase [Collinsella stercoris]